MDIVVKANIATNREVIELFKKMGYVEEFILSGSSDVNNEFYGVVDGLLSLWYAAELAPNTQIITLEELRSIYYSQKDVPSLELGDRITSGDIEGYYIAKTKEGYLISDSPIIDGKVDVEGLRIVKDVSKVIEQWDRVVGTDVDGVEQIGHFISSFGEYAVVYETLACNKEDAFIIKNFKRV
jgi:hypothetical protein